MPIQKLHSSGGEGWAELLSPLGQGNHKESRAKPQDFMFHTTSDSKTGRDELSRCLITFLIGIKVK